MKTMYAVYTGSYDDYGLSKLFSTSELAEEYIRRRNYGELVELEVDDMPKLMSFEFVGNSTDTKRLNYRKDSCFNSYGNIETEKPIISFCSFQSYRNPQYKEFIFDIIAKDFDTAKTIAMKLLMHYHDIPELSEKIMEYKEIVWENVDIPKYVINYE